MSPPHHLELPVELPKITSLPPTLLYSWEITTAEHQKTEIKLLIRATAWGLGPFNLPLLLTSQVQ